MEFSSSSLTKNSHFTRYGVVGLEFNAEAIEIVLLDGRGRIVWQKRRGKALESLRWEGRNIHGEPVGVGTYTCKITYPGEPAIYLPFVFMR